MLKKPLCLFASLLVFVRSYRASAVSSGPSSAFSFWAEQCEQGGRNEAGVFLAKAKASDKKKKSNKKEKAQSAPQAAESQEEFSGEVTAISVDKNRAGSSGYFSGIPKSVLDQVEKGSAESLLQAYNEMKKASVDYAENERVLVFVITELLKTVWPSQVQNAALDSPPDVPARNIYTGAIESAKKGIYDTSAGNADFLADALPSLVLKSPVTNAGYYAESEERLKAALALCPQSVLARYLLALLYSRSSRNAEAAELLKAAAQDTKAFEVHYLLASCLNALGRYEESKAVTDSLIVLYPSNVDLLKLLSRNAYSSGDYSTAERYALLVLQQNPADLDMVLFRAKIFVATGEFLKATSLLDVYAKSNANAKDYLLLRAKVQKEWNRNAPLAISTVEKALSLYPDDLDVLLQAAGLASESGSLVGKKSGEELATMALAAAPDNQEALSFLIQTLAQDGKWSEAYASSKKIMSSPNPSVDAICAHVRICLALGNNGEAWENASALYTRRPDDEKAVQLYVECMVRTGRASQASRFINSSINSASSSMKSFLYYQRSFLASGEAAQLSDLRSAVIANPRNSDALFRMYGIYLGKKDYRKAQYYLRQVIALNPNNQNYLRLNSELDRLIAGSAN